MRSAGTKPPFSSTKWGWVPGRSSACSRQTARNRLGGSRRTLTSAGTGVVE